MRAASSIVASLALATLLAGHARADDEPRKDPLAGLSGKRALEFAKVLAADDMKGRKTGFEGGAKAESWVAGQFTNFGLDPMDPDGDYMDPFTFSAVDVVPPIVLAVDGAPVEFGTGYTDLLYTGQGTVEADVVFVGFGIAAPERGWDDYAGIDVKGKVVLALRGAPEAREGDFPVEKLIGYKSAQARDHGAAAFLIVEGKSPVPGTIIPKYTRQDLPALWIASAVADRILAKQGKTLADLRRPRDAGDPGQSFATGTKARVEVHATFVPQATGRNALAGIAGSDPDLRGEVVIVGAHMDHLGVNPMGQVFNGADDNASGTATLLMLAETLAKNRWRPKRTVVFCAFAGEEQGLVGSRNLAATLPFTHTSIVAMINMDQTGQGTTDVNVGGGEGHPALWKRLKAALPATLQPTVHPFRVADNSDHWPFYVRGIPAFFAVTSGDHPNYHMVTDDLEGLKSECMEAAARVVGSMLVNLGDDEKPVAPGNGLADYLLHEGVRVVEGPTADAWLGDANLSRKDHTVPQVAGWTGVVQEASGRVVERMVQLRELLREPPPHVVVTGVLRASDLTNAAKGGGLALLWRCACASSVRGNPAFLATVRDHGFSWVDPFDRKSLPTDVERDAILDAATAARVVVDLTNLPTASLAAARARPKDSPATYRLGGAATSEQVAALRKTLGPSTLLLVGTLKDAAPFLAPHALVAPPDPALAPVVITCEDTAGLAALLEAAVANADLALDDPDSPARARVRFLLGGAWVDLLRRL